MVTEALTVLASVAEQREHFQAVLAALLDCFRGAAGARLLQVGGRAGAGGRLVCVMRTSPYQGRRGRDISC